MRGVRRRESSYNVADGQVKRETADSLALEAGGRECNL